MSTPKQHILYQQDLGINFNGYPIENIDETTFCENVSNNILDNQALRLHKNLNYEVVVIIREKEEK
jgi:UDP:flavonoid glycosyltransferase YjiC (YdhE family)